jgi:putative endonuclease
MYYVYIIYSERSDRYYVGYAADVIARLARHNSGRVSSTQNFIPYRLCGSKEFEHELDAIREERRIKKQKNRKYIEWLLHGNW